MITISEGDASDIASIMPVMEEAFDPTFGEAWNSAQCLSALAIPNCSLLIGRAGQNIAGFALSRWVMETEELLMIGVSPAWQRQGVGSMILARLIDDARTQGRQTIFLEVRDGNPAHDFYKESGFQPIGRRKQYYRGSDGVRPDAITMAMNI